MVYSNTGHQEFEASSCIHACTWSYHNLYRFDQVSYSLVASEPALLRLSHLMTSGPLQVIALLTQNFKSELLAQTL